MTLQLDYAGPEAYDVTTKNGAFAGIIARQRKGHWRVYFNSTATRGSARKFQTAKAAVDFIVERRVKKGWTV